MASETLREYLVKLGWDVNKQGFDNATDLVDRFAVKLMSKAGAMGTAFISASAAMVKASLATVDAILDIAFSVAEADTAVERLARKYWISEQSARSLQNAQEQLEISVEDLMYATDEEYKRFLRLNEYGKSLEAPAALDDTLVKIRDIQFEISKTKSIISYGSRWLMYYLGQYLGYDIDELITKYKSFNEWLRTNLPKITQKVAKFLSIAWRFAKTVLTLIYNLGKGIVQVVERLGTSGVAAIVALAAAFKLAAMGPIGLVLMGLTAIVLLLEDFMVWKQGGKSLFDWSGIEEPMTSLWDSVLSVSSSVGDLISAFGNLFSTIDGGKSSMSWLGDILKTVSEFINFISVGLTDIAALLDPKNAKLQEKAEKGTAGLIRKFGNFAAPIVEFFGGSGENVKKGANSFADMLDPYAGGRNPTGEYNPTSSTSGFVWTPDMGVNSRNQSYTSNFNGNIIVNAGSNASPTAIADKVVDRVKAIQFTSNPNTRMTR
jgi:hypothetical protein